MMNLPENEPTRPVRMPGNTSDRQFDILEPPQASRISGASLDECFRAKQQPARCPGAVQTQLCRASHPGFENRMTAGSQCKDSYVQPLPSPPSDPHKIADV